VIKNIAQRIQLNALVSGISIRIRELAYPQFFQAIQTGNFDLFYGCYLPESTQPETLIRELFVEPNRGTAGNFSFSITQNSCPSWRSTG